MSIEGQGHFLTLAQGRVHTKIQTGFSQKQPGLEIIFGTYSSCGASGLNFSLILTYGILKGDKTLITLFSISKIGFLDQYNFDVSRFRTQR